MGTLQTVEFGAASDGSQGDSTRTGFTKGNANTAVLQAQSTLTSFATTLTAPVALTAAQHLGQRVNVNLATSGTIQVPTAASCGADGIILIRNVGATNVTLAITTGSGDTLALTVLAAGEAAWLDTDGVHAWNCLLRGRTSSANEVVQGNSSVLGNESVGGTLTVTGATALATISATGAYSGTTGTYSGGVTIAGQLGVTGLTTVGALTIGRATGSFSQLFTLSSANFNIFERINNSSGALEILNSAGSAVLASFDQGGGLSMNVGYICKTGTGGGFTGNAFNINFSASAVQLWVGSSNLGNITLSSDYRAKTIIDPVASTADALAAVNATRVIKFRYKSFGILSDDGVERVGFIAHEIQKHVEGAVYGVKDGVDENGDPIIQTVDPLPIIAKLWAAVQELSEKVARLESV